MNKGWTVIEVAKSAWASTRLNEPWAVEMIYPDFPPKEYPHLQVLALREILDRAEEKGLEPSEHQVNLPQQVGAWMTALGLASLYTLEKATLSLSRNQRLDMLSRWFNGGGGLPAQGPEPGKHGEQTRLNLGHPAIFNQFLRWLIRYLALHESVDGRVDRDCERVINLCHEIQDKAPVRRY